jgi:hypothetical protein
VKRREEKRGGFIACFSDFRVAMDDICT